MRCASLQVKRGGHDGFAAGEFWARSGPMPVFGGLTQGPHLVGRKSGLVAASCLGDGKRLEG